MAAKATIRKVMIDGVQYVPVSQAAPTLAAIEDAIISQWAGDDWRRDYPDSPNYLRVVVSDTFDDPDEGETVTEFLARIVIAIAAPPPGEAGAF